MKKLHKLALAAVLAVSVAAPTAFLGAQTDAELGVANTGLLPSNPFYFLKEWGRGFRKFITPSLIKKSEVELEVLNQKAAELKKLDEITASDLKAVRRALASYQVSLNTLLGYLTSVEGSNLPAEASFGLSEHLIPRAVIHYRLIENLALSFPTDETLLAEFETSKQDLLEALAFAAEHVSGADLFRSVFSDVVSNFADAFKELRAAEIADRLADLLDGGTAAAVAELREDLLSRFGGRLEGLALAGAGLGDLENVPGDRYLRIRLLDEVRDRVLNPDLRNELNIVRQGVLRRLDEEASIGKERAEEAIADAKALLEKIEASLSETPAKAVQELLDRAKFHISQAERFLIDVNYGGAFGQATAAQSALKNAQSRLWPTVIDFPRQLERAQADYDFLREKITASGLTSADYPQLFLLLSDTERRIVELAKLIEKGVSAEKILPGLRTVKVLLSAIEELFSAIMNPVSLPPAGAGPAEGQPEIQQTSVFDASVSAVQITSKGFAPNPLKIKVGTKVVWTNRDITPHWPISATAGFDANQGMSQDEIFEFVFEKAGIWKYNDKLNPGLTGVVEVSE